jgi:hypothetical protein
MAGSKRVLAISTFPSTNDLGPITGKNSTWADLTDFLANRALEAAEKKALRLLKLAKFGDTRNPNGKGSYRWNGNVEYLSGLVAEHDAGTVSLDEAAKRLEALGVGAFFYTSPSHTPEKPRWRVLAPLSVDTPPVEHGRLMDRLNGALGGILAGESWTLTQIFYFGKVTGSVYETRKVEGHYIDRPKFDKITPIPKPTAVVAASKGPNNTEDEPQSYDARVPVAVAGESEIVAELRRRLIRDGFAWQANPQWWRSIAIVYDATKAGLEEEGRALVIELSRPGWSKADSKYTSIEAEIDAVYRNLRGRTHVEHRASIHSLPPADDPNKVFGPLLDVDLTAKVEAEERAARIAKFTWLSPLQILNRPAPNWIVKSILPDAVINMLFGPSGAGKSFVALDMSLAIVRGIPWRDHKVKQGAVGWIAAEAAGSMRNRLAAYCRQHKLKPEAVAGFCMLGEGVDLTKREDVRVLAESARPLAPVLIVVDTLAAAAGSANENAGEDMNPVLDNCKMVAEITGASVLLIHHSGKDESKGSRGWSGIKARVDAQIEVKKRAGDPKLRDITVEKQRDGEEGDAMVFELLKVTLEPDEDGDPVTSCVVQHGDKQSGLKRANAKRKGQGKWHHAIRAALLDAPGERLEGEALILAATAKVPEDQRTTNPGKQLKATANEMLKLGELRVADGYYGFAAPTNPDAVDPAEVEF